MKPNAQRAWLYGIGAAVAGWILWRMFYPDYVADRCREIAYRAVVSNIPPPPSDILWHAEHCVGGAAR